MNPSHPLPQLAIVACILAGCPSVMPSGRFVQVTGSRARLYLEPRWEDAKAQPGEVFRFERGAGTLRPLAISVVALAASEWKSVSEAFDARERAFRVVTDRTPDKAIRVSGIPGFKRAFRVEFGGDTWATFIYGFVVDDRLVLLHGFAKPRLAEESESDFDALVSAIQILVP